MRTVVVEVVLIVLGVVLALMLGLGLISWVTGVLNNGVQSSFPKAVQVMAVDFNKKVVYVRTVDGSPIPKGDYRVFVDGKDAKVRSVSCSGSYAEIKFSETFSASERHTVIVYGPNGLISSLYYYIP